MITENKLDDYMSYRPEHLMISNPLIVSQEISLEDLNSYNKKTN